MKIRICNKCKGFDYKKIIAEIDKLDLEIKYEVGCNSMCGIGRDNIVLIVNNKTIVAKNIRELIEKIKGITN